MKAVSHTDEEVGTRKGTSDFHWYTDPVDGTKSYVTKTDNFFGTIVGLLYMGEPILGVTYQPSVYSGAGELVFALKGEGAFRRIGSAKKNKIYVAPSDSQPILMKSYTTPKPPHLISSKIISELISEVPKTRIQEASSVLKANTIAMGQAHMYFSLHKFNLWDVVGPKAIVEEAGGLFTDPYGGKDFDCGILVTSSRFLHETLINIISDIHPKKEK